MNKISSIFILLMTITISCYCQSKIYIGTREYPSIENPWKFESLFVNFAKCTSTTGIIVVTTPENEFVQETLGSKLFLYLSNGKQIILSNRIATDHVNGQTSAAYSVNVGQLNSLKVWDIRQVRYSLIPEFGNVKNYSVINETTQYKTIEMPVLDGDSMSEYERVSKNVKQRTIYPNTNDPFYNSFERRVEYYRYETFPIGTSSIQTASAINTLYL